MHILKAMILSSSHFLFVINNTEITERDGSIMCNICMHNSSYNTCLGMEDADMVMVEAKEPRKGAKRTRS